MATLFLIVIYAAFISLGLPDSLLGVAWPAMRPEMHVPLSYAGMISVVISGGTIVSSLFSSRLLRRFGVGRITLVSVFLTACALLGFALCPSFWFLVLLAVPLGLGAGAIDSGLNAYVAAHYRAHHMNWLHCFWGLGAMLGPNILSAFLARGQSWRRGYFLIAMIQFGLTVVLLFALPLWEKVAAVTQSQSTEEPLPPPAQEPLFTPLKLPGAGAVFLAFLLYCGAESTMGLWCGSFLISVRGVGLAQAAVWVSLFYGSITAGRLLSGFLSLRAGNKLLIRGGQCILAAGAVLLLLPLPNLCTVAGIALIGLGCAPIFPCMLHETPVRFGKHNAQAVMGFQMAVAYVGAALLPPLFGLLAGATTVALMPWAVLLYAVGMLLSSEHVNRLMRRGKLGRQLKQESSV